MDPAPGLRERKKQRTRAAISEAAMRLFAERGFDHVTIADVAEAADIAPRTFFAYFPSKEDVIFSDFQESFDGLAATLRDRPKGTSAIDAMRGWIAGLVEADTFDQDQLCVRRDLITASEAVAARERHLRGHFEQLLAEAVADDLGDDPSHLRPRMVAAAATAALYLLEYEEDVSDEDPMAEVDQALLFLRGGLAALQDAG